VVDERDERHSEEAIIHKKRSYHALVGADDEHLVVPFSLPPFSFSHSPPPLHSAPASLRSPRVPANAAHSRGLPIARMRDGHAAISATSPQASVLRISPEKLWGRTAPATATEVSEEEAARKPIVSTLTVQRYEPERTSTAIRSMANTQINNILDFFEVCSELMSGTFYDCRIYCSIELELRRQRHRVASSLNTRKRSDDRSRSSVSASAES